MILTHDLLQGRPGIGIVAGKTFENGRNLPAKIAPVTPRIQATILIISLELSVDIRRTHPPAYRPFTPRRLSSTKFRSSFHPAASGRFQNIALTVVRVSGSTAAFNLAPGSL